MNSSLKDGTLVSVLQDHSEGVKCGVSQLLPVDFKCPLQYNPIAAVGKQHVTSSVHCLATAVAHDSDMVCG